MSGPSGLIQQFIDYKNPTGAEPIPNSALMNDTQNMTISVESGTTYFVRLISVAAFAGMYVYVEDHEMTIIEVDGVYTKPQVANMIYVANSQRYGVLITAKPGVTKKNFAIVASMDTVGNAKSACNNAPTDSLDRACSTSSHHP